MSEQQDMSFRRDRTFSKGNSVSLICLLPQTPPLTCRLPSIHDFNVLIDTDVRWSGVCVDRWSSSISNREPQESLIVPVGSTYPAESSSGSGSYFQLSVKLQYVKYPQSNHNQ